MGLIRLLLAISVVIAHSSDIFGFSFVGGKLAVQTFFIVSGFYMTLILNEKYIGKNNSYKLFISNRFLRLYPIYWTVLIITIFYGIGFSLYNGSPTGSIAPYVEYFDTLSIGSITFLIFTNLFIFLQDMVMFMGLDLKTGNLFFTSNFWETSPPLYNFLFLPQAWSIGIEIAFYILAPFLVRKKLIIIIPLILLSVLLRVILINYGLDYDPWSYRFFPTELAFFLMGVLNYHMYRNLQKRILRPLILKIVWCSIIIFILFYNFLPLPYKDIIYIITFFISLPYIFILSKNWKWDRYIGELSYPIYISHLFVLKFIIAFKILMLGGLGLALTVCTIIFSVLLIELVSKRIEDIRSRRVIP
tara:strand:+ start:3084 stop:4160 length:1077 start_codon:yes stop_codon:yes gene_type:complete